MSIRLVFEDARPQAPLHVPPYHVEPMGDGAPSLEMHRDGSRYVLRAASLGDFVIDGSPEVKCAPIPGAPREVLHQTFRSWVWPFAVSREPKLVLKASAVVVEGVVVAFVGASGRGKSTLAASFAARGYPLVTDEALVIDSSKEGLTAPPGHPEVRLWRDSLEGVFGPPDPARRRAHDDTKVRLLAGDVIGHATAPKRLGAMCVLGDERVDHAALVPIRAATAIIELTQHAFVLDVEDGTTLELHFAVAGRIAAEVPCFRLDFARRYGAAPATLEAILAVVAPLLASTGARPDSRPSLRCIPGGAGRS